MLRPVGYICSRRLPGRPRISFAGDTRRSRSSCDSREVLMLALHFRTEALPMALLDEVVHQFARTVVHLDVERLHLAGEVVERHNGGDGDEKAECRGDKSLRNTTGHCADT